MQNDGSKIRAGAASGNINVEILHHRHQGRCLKYISKLLSVDDVGVAIALLENCTRSKIIKVPAMKYGVGKCVRYSDTFKHLVLLLISSLEYSKYEISTHLGINQDTVGKWSLNEEEAVVKAMKILPLVLKERYANAMRMIAISVNEGRMDVAPVIKERLLKGWAETNHNEELSLSICDKNDHRDRSLISPPPHQTKIPCHDLKNAITNSHDQSISDNYSSIRDNLIQSLDSIEREIMERLKNIRNAISIAE